MEDVNKIKPYIAHLNKQCKLLKPELDKLTAKSLDEQLLLLSDERAKLDLTNKYAYVLSSLMFAYMKVLNIKDMTPIMNELNRVKTYMSKASAFDKKSEKELQRIKDEQERAKRVINSALDGRHTGPAISKVNFAGKHTKFDKEKENEEEDDYIPGGEMLAKKIKESKDQQKNKKKSNKNQKGKITKKR